MLLLAFVTFAEFEWGIHAENHVHYQPTYSMENIEGLIFQEYLTSEDYETLFLQTGLAKPIVDALRKEGKQQELLLLQKRFFEKIQVECCTNTMFSRTEVITDVGSTRVAEVTDAIPYVEEGDILISFNCHAFGWRNGHAAIVVDSGRKLTLEAIVLGTDSSVLSLGGWEDYPSFAVLRLNGVDGDTRKAIATWAEENLADIPYSLTAGMTWHGKEAFEEGTQCAHLIWCAYSKFGYDLDSDGGFLVTPRDIYDSPLLEVIQIYGINPNENKLLKKCK